MHSNDVFYNDNNLCSKFYENFPVSFPEKPSTQSLCWTLLGTLVRLNFPKFFEHRKQEK